ncbi:MAG: SHOCT domain-containing protein [Sulfurimonas sp.]|nr:SHOCT domain-containing protein [Sulfurimonas sp.]
MSISNNYDGYKKVLKKHNITEEETHKFLRSVKRWEVFQKTVLFFSLSFIALIVFALAGGTKGDAGLGAALMLFLASLTGVTLYIIAVEGKKNRMAAIDELLFNGLIIHKIKVFYSTSEASKYSYEKIKHVTTSSVNAKVFNQPIIDLCYKAFDEGAEGVIITNQGTVSHTSGSTNRRGTSNVSTSIISSAEGIFIKDIKKEEVELPSIPAEKVDKNDILYWYNLLEKGAITDEEYEAKKKELLS